METCRFEFTGLHGRLAACGIERVDLADGRVVIIATELADNPGVSITNFAEELAGIVCERLRIDPRKLVWIEHYPRDPCPVCQGARFDLRYDRPCRACKGIGYCREVATYDLATFTLTGQSQSRFAHPKWQPMTEAIWEDLGLAVRA